MIIKEQIKKFLESHFFDLILFISSLSSLIYIFIKTLYIQITSRFFILSTYYFEHLSLNYFLTATIIFTVFLAALNFYNIVKNKHFKFFYFFISIYYILWFGILLVNKIFPFHSCIYIAILITLVSLYLKKFCPLHILFSLELFILFLTINFYSIKFKKEYEIATMANYQKVVIITLQGNDYLVTPFQEKDNILYININKRKWINRLEPINIETQMFKNIEIIKK